jgi:hypothetical protein
MSTTQRNHAQRVAVPSSTVAVLREQTLAVLEFAHHRFEDLRDLTPEEQLAAAAVFRDAFAVLDALGWTPTDPPVAVDIDLTAGHLAELRRCHRDLTLTIRDSRATRAEQTSLVDVRDVDRRIASDRAALKVLGEILARATS